MLALIVDDDASMCALLEKFLETTGNILETTGNIKVSVARNGQEGLTKVQAEQPNVVFSDLNMPVMDGLQFWQALRANANTVELPFVLITSDNSSATMEKKKQIFNDQYAWVVTKNNLTLNWFVNFIRSLESMRDIP